MKYRTSESPKTLMSNNIDLLNAELDWLSQVINQVIRSYLKQEGHEAHWMDIELPSLEGKLGVYAIFVTDWQLGIYERLAIALSLAPHLRPELLDVLFAQNTIDGRDFTEFGGVTHETFGGFLPTGQTLSFLICANDPQWRTESVAILDPNHRLMSEQVLSLELTDHIQPAISGILKLSDQWLHYLVSGEKVRPEPREAFPAHPITTPMDWSDLILDSSVMAQIQELNTWLLHSDTLMDEWGLAKKIKPGYRALFYGPPGTGKTLTATLLAKTAGREIYRVDLSVIVSKYIGETEKNLAKVFDAASNKDWILFFDEADALFGRRTEATSSNDGHANQQIAYLLQRIESFPSLVILSTTLKTNMYDAFTRRFQSMIHFAIPAPEQRLLLWKKAFEGICELDHEVDLEKLAHDYELTGEAIVSVLRYCATQAINKGRRGVSHDDIVDGIRWKFRKNKLAI